MKKYLFVIVIALPLVAGILPTIQGYDGDGRAIWKADESKRIDIVPKNTRYDKGQPDFNNPSSKGFENSELSVIRVSLKSINILKEYGKGSMSGSDMTFSARLGNSFSIDIYPKETKTQHNLPTKLWCSYTVHNGQPTLYIDTESSEPIKIPVSVTTISTSDMRTISAVGANAKLISASVEVLAVRR